MVASNSPPGDAFVITCVRCGGFSGVSSSRVGRDVQCPHCACTLRVPPPRTDGQPTLANIRPPNERVCSFSCKRCRCILEAPQNLSGESGRCPTCGARFRIPEFDPRTGAPDDYPLMDADDQDPVPMHAYAASGTQAPRIIESEGSEPVIECRRCGTRNPITADSCSGCRVPFTMDAAPVSASSTQERRADAALVLSLISLPLCQFLVPAALAVLFAVSSRDWAAGRMPTTGVAALLIGLLSLAMGFAILVFA